MTGSWKNASGVLESTGNICNQESGNPFFWNKWKKKPVGNYLTEVFLENSEVVVTDVPRADSINLDLPLFMLLLRKFC